jgi:16S rRNA (cytosine967-C5)-methyltransferase
MKDSARVQAAIELLDEIIAAARNAGPAADNLIQDFFKRRRFAGSGDRRAIRELAYQAIRRSGDVPVSGRAAMLGVGQDDPDLLKLFDWTVRAPVPPVAGEPVSEARPLPKWLAAELDPLIDEAETAALLDRAPLDLRVNRLKGSRDEAWAVLPEAEPTPLSRIGLRLPEGFRIVEHEVWKSGLVEIQDEGSQLATLACASADCQAVVDLCAGAGGKTLALAAEMGNKGRILACDVDRARLSRLAPRAERSGATNIGTRLLNPKQELAALRDWQGKADLVLVDAPCSGSGTWRRNPETRWRLTPKRLEQLRNVQEHLLDIAVELVRPGGHLVYVVCSVLGSEGRGQAEAMAGRHSALVPQRPLEAAGRDCGPGVMLTPAHDNVDGFFVARWQVSC